jgi:hypothetical protein
MPINVPGKSQLHNDFIPRGACNGRQASHLIAGGYQSTPLFNRDLGKSALERSRCWRIRAPAARRQGGLAMTRLSPMSMERIAFAYLS